MYPARKHGNHQYDGVDATPDANAVPPLSLTVSSLPAIYAIDILERAGQTAFHTLRSCLVSQGMDSLTTTELLALDGARFQSLPGIGRTKREALERLQHTLRASGFTPADPDGETHWGDPVAGRMQTVSLSVEQRAMPVEQLAWSRAEKQGRCFRRLLKASPGMKVQDVLKSDGCPHWFAARVRDLSPQWQERHRLLNDAMTAPTPQSQLQRLSELLEHDTISVLRACTDRDRRITEARWGWDCAPQILEDLATEFGVTRERVRQIQKEAEENLCAYTLVDSHRVRELTGALCVPSLPSAVSALASHMKTAAGLASFLESVCGSVFDDDELRDYYRNRLIPVFCTTNPVDRQMLHGLLHARTGDLIRATNDATKLQDLGLIELQEDGLVSPRSLTQADAVAHVLSDRAYAKGMHWTELIHIANEGKFCEQPISQERQGSFLHSPHVALCGVGHYAHTQYLASTSVPEAVKLRLLSAVHGLAIEANGPLPLKEAFEYLQADVSLREDMVCLAADGTDAAYYALRHLIKADGHRVGGMHLDGTSSRDEISLAAAQKRPQLPRHRRHSLGKTCGAPEKGRRGLAA